MTSTCLFASLSLFFSSNPKFCVSSSLSSSFSHCCKTSVLISWHAAYLSIEFIQFKSLIKSNVKLLVNRGTSFLFKIAKIAKINWKFQQLIPPHHNYVSKLIIAIEIKRKLTNIWEHKMMFHVWR